MRPSNCREIGRAHPPVPSGSEAARAVAPRLATGHPRLNVRSWALRVRGTLEEGLVHAARRFPIPRRRHGDAPGHRLAERHAAPVGRGEPERRHQPGLRRRRQRRARRTRTTTSSCSTAGTASQSLDRLVGPVRQRDRHRQLRRDRRPTADLPDVSLAPGSTARSRRSRRRRSARHSRRPTSPTPRRSTWRRRRQGGARQHDDGLGCNGSRRPPVRPSWRTIVDLVGYGTANFFEGARSRADPPRPRPLRSAASAGCTDTDNNGRRTSPAPRRRGTPHRLTCACAASRCRSTTSSQAEGRLGSHGSSTSPSACPSAARPGGVTFDIATQDDTATSADDDYIADVA